MSKSPRRIERETVILCDDIRREDNGKILIIGMYPGNIGLPIFPAQINISLLMLFRPIENGEVDIKLEIRKSWNDKKVGALVKLVIDDSIPREQSLVAAATGVPLVLEQPGEILLMYQYDDEEWELIKKFPIILNSNISSVFTPSNAQEPPA